MLGRVTSLKSAREQLTTIPGRVVQSADVLHERALKNVRKVPVCHAGNAIGENTRGVPPFETVEKQCSHRRVSVGDAGVGVKCQRKIQGDPQPPDRTIGIRSARGAGEVVEVLCAALIVVLVVACVGVQTVDQRVGHSCVLEVVARSLHVFWPAAGRTTSLDDAHAASKPHDIGRNERPPGGTLVGQQD